MSSSRSASGFARARSRKPAPEDVGRRLEVDHQIGDGQIGREQLVEPLIDEELVVVEIQVGVDLVPLEQVVADRQLAEEVGLSQLRLLPMAGQRVEQLRLESRAGRPDCASDEKRIVGVVEDDGRIETRAEPVGQARLADADGPFDRDVPEVQGRAQYTADAQPRAGRCRVR